MPRSADYAIQGFLYQFNKTLLEILNANEDDVITIEGVVEDIEVAASTLTTATQCKYHEASEAFTASAIYKPLLQMLAHFAGTASSNVRYVLFAHFPGAGASPSIVDATTLRAAMASRDQTLKKPIKAVPIGVDLAGFLARFKMEFGPSYAEIVRQVMSRLQDYEKDVGDIETLAYPNAIHRIALLSIQHDESARKVTKKQLLDELGSIRTTAISRWTLALTTWRKLLEARRKQLKVHLSQNSRLRYFVVDPQGVTDYDGEIVIFLGEYIEKFHTKAAHISTPIFCVNRDRQHIQDLQLRLFSKGLTATDGYIGTEFQESHFFREPLSAKLPGSKIRREFDVRLLSWNDHGSVLSNRRADDLFVIGETDCSTLNTTDVNVERLSGLTMKELKFVMGLSNAAD